jgi:RhtB (resistance to homoserine/threonine) family protein
MNPLALIATISLINLLAVISPGPDFVMAVRNSLKYSRKTGIHTAVGFGLGIATHITYCLAGLAVIISQSILLFNAIKILGAAYLIYIGIKSILAKSSKIDVDAVTKKKDISPWQAVKIGYLTNILNPKATLFYLGLFTLVITSQTPPAVLAAASAIMVATIVAWFSLVAVFMTNKHIRAIYSRFQKAINKTLGGFLVLLGLKIAVSGKE